MICNNDLFFGLRSRPTSCYFAGEISMAPTDAYSNCAEASILSQNEDLKSSDSSYKIGNNFCAGHSANKDSINTSKI